MSQTTHLEPIDRSSTGFVSRVRRESLDHETLAAIFDTVVEEFRNLLAAGSIRTLGKSELAFNGVKVLLQEFPPFYKLFLQERLGAKT